VHLARSIHSWRTKTPVNSQNCVIEATNNFVQNGNGTIMTNEGFSVYPNPTANNLTVQISEDYLEIPLTFILVDVTGKTSINTKSIIETTNFELETTPLPDGIYFLKAYDQSKECETNNLRLLIGYLVHIFHFKNVHYININHTFKVETMNEISLSKIVVYSFHIPNQVFSTKVIISK